MSSGKIKVTTGSSGKLQSPKTVKVRTPAPKTTAPKLATMSGTKSKETIYVDVDDEITAIIDKLQQAKGSIVALVLPKRATVMQSIVNMKLLKRTAQQAGKNLVLVTSEASLLPLAGLVGLHVAETPSSKPTIPAVPDQPSDEPESIDEPLSISDNSGVPAEDFDAVAAAATPVGELAGIPPAAMAVDPVEEVVMDDAADGSATANTAPKPDVTPVKKNKKLAVPNFDAFRLRVALGILAFIVLIVGWIFATRVLPTATVSIQTDSQVVKSNLNLTLDTAAQKVDTTNKIVPAVAQSSQKSYTQQVPTTGQQNKGTKAAGSFTVVNCSDNSATAEAGSSVTANGHTYIIQSTVTIPSSNFYSNGKCKNDGKGTISVVALKGGSDYNVSGATFSNPNLEGTGSASGGTDNVVKVVSQGDIDGAKAKIAAQDTAKLKQDLAAAVKAKGLLPVASTFLAGDQQVTTSANVGDEADTVTVTVNVPYTMLGIKQDDLKTIVMANVNDQIDTKKQKVLDDGTAKATFTQQTPGSTTTAVVNAKVQSVAGPEINTEQLKQDVAGKKSGDIQDLIGDLPGVTDVQVHYSPFWVSTVPKNTTKITVNIAKPSGA